MSCRSGCVYACRLSSGPPRSELKAPSELLREVMPSALALSPVPLKIDLKTGDNWADMS